MRERVRLFPTKLSCEAPEMCPHAFSSIPPFATNGVMFQKSRGHGLLVKTKQGRDFFKMSLSPSSSSCCSPGRSPVHSLGLQGVCLCVHRVGAWAAEQGSVGGRMESRPSAVCPHPLCAWDLGSSACGFGLGVLWPFFIFLR